MNIDVLIDAMTPEIYQRLLYATETGRWPEGEALTLAQKDQSMQLVMLYQSRFNESAAHMSVAKGGEIVMKSKSELKSQFADQEIIHVEKIHDSNDPES